MPNEFAQAVRGSTLAIAAELTLKRDSGPRDVLDQAEALGRCVDGIQVTDNPYGWVQMSALAASALLVERGYDPVPVLSCRDRNRTALESDLLGFQALGVTSLMLMRGHRIPKDHAVPATSVFDLTGRELITLAASLDDGFFIGTGARAFRPGPRWKADSLTARYDAGARFVQTQMCFNMQILERYMERFVAAGLDRKFSVIVSLSPLPSAATAIWIKKNMSDSRIPAALIERLDNAGDPKREGIEICAELMREISRIPGVSGINLMTTGDPDAIPAAVRASGLRGG